MYAHVYAYLPLAEPHPPQTYTYNAVHTQALIYTQIVQYSAFLKRSLRIKRHYFMAGWGEPFQSLSAKEFEDLRDRGYVACRA
jgi:hypothetical protein